MPSGIYKRIKHWKLSEEKKRFGDKNSFYGKHHTEKSKKKNSDSQKKNPVRYWLGKKRTPFTEDHKRKIGEGAIERMKGNTNGFKKGKENPNWNNGSSFEPYGLEFNNDLREGIRNRDRRKCQLCEKTDLEEGKKLSIHHINYNKQNNNPDNLISLCWKCHLKTNKNRDYWIKFLKQSE